MNQKDVPPEEKHAPETGPKADRKRRKHGYRGYPNQPAGGAVHIGSGFAGVGSTGGGGGAGLSDSGIISERTREDVESEEDE